MDIHVNIICICVYIYVCVCFCVVYRWYVHDLYSTMNNEETLLQDFLIIPKRKLQKYQKNLEEMFPWSQYHSDKFFQSHSVNRVYHLFHEITTFIFSLGLFFVRIYLFPGRRVRATIKTVSQLLTEAKTLSTKSDVQKTLS